MADGLDLAFSTKLPPERAIDFLRSKGIGVSWDWHDTWMQAHQRVFVVAKAVKLDVLSTIKQGLLDAQARGITRRQFVKEMEPKLRALGWWGRQTQTAPDGVEELVQLGSPRRLKTIFDTNMRTALNATRWQAQQTLSAGPRPYIQYLSMDDSRVRPTHLLMNRRVFPADDPIWHTHYPPNGFNCRCRTRFLTEAQVKRMGLPVFRTGTAEGGVLSETAQVVGINRRTGEEIVRPATRYTFEAGGKLVDFTPDPGWSYNPGRQAPPLAPANRIGPLVGGQTTATQLGLPALAMRPRRPRLPPPSNAAVAEAQIMSAIGGSVTQGFVVVGTPVGDVPMSLDFVKRLARDGERAFAELTVPTLRDPAEAWLQTTVGADGRIVYERSFVGDHGAFVAVREHHKSSTVGWSLGDAESIERLRAGYLLYRRSAAP